MKSSICPEARTAARWWTAQARAGGLPVPAEDVPRELQQFALLMQQHANLYAPASKRDLEVFEAFLVLHIQTLVDEAIRRGLFDRAGATFGIDEIPSDELLLAATKIRVAHLWLRVPIMTHTKLRPGRVILLQGGRERNIPLT